MTPDFAALATRISQRLPHVDCIEGIVGYGMPTPPPPLDLADLNKLENELDMALPPILREIYLNISNGGFGPGYGLMGMGPNGFRDDIGDTVDSRHTKVRGYDPSWPKELLAICHFGCAVYHCVNHATGEIVVWEPNVVDDNQPAAIGLFPTGVSIGVWFDRWSRGETVYMYKVTEPGEFWS